MYMFLNKLGKFIMYIIKVANCLVVRKMASLNFNH